MYESTHSTFTFIMYAKCCFYLKPYVHFAQHLIAHKIWMWDPPTWKIWKIYAVGQSVLYHWSLDQNQERSFQLT